MEFSEILVNSRMNATNYTMYFEVRQSFIKISLKARPVALNMDFNNGKNSLYTSKIEPISMDSPPMKGFSVWGN